MPPFPSGLIVNVIDWSDSGVENRRIRWLLYCLGEAEVTVYYRFKIERIWSVLKILNRNYFIWNYLQLSASNKTNFISFMS